MKKNLTGGNRENRAVQTFALSVLCLLLFNFPVWAQLTAAVQPGYVFAPGERPTTATLNQLGQPTISIAGTVTGTVGLGAGTVTGTHLANSVPDNVTISFNTSSPRQLQIVPQVGGVGGGVSTNQINSNVCGPGLAGGSGSPLYVTNVAAAQLSTNVFGTGLGVVGGAVVITNYQNLVTITNVGFVTNFTSGEKALVNGQIDNEAHGLPGTPRSVSWVLVCKTAEFGFAVGDEVASQFVALTGANGAVLTGGGNSTNVWLSCQDATAISACRKDNGNRVALTQGNWKAKCYASYSF